MAIVGNSYLYHMRKDLVENIQPGVGQNMGENALALIHYLTTSPKSPIPELVGGYVKPQTVFFSYLGGFVIFSFDAAKKMYMALVAGTVGYILVAGGLVGVGAGSTKTVTWPALLKDHGKGMLAVTVGIIGSNAGANLAALVMQRVLGKGMSWFSSVYSPLVLYAPPAIFGGRPPLPILCDDFTDMMTSRCPVIPIPRRSNSRTDGALFNTAHANVNIARVAAERYRLSGYLLLVVFPIVLDHGRELPFDWYRREWRLGCAEESFALGICIGTVRAVANGNDDPRFSVGGVRSFGTESCSLTRSFIS